MWYSPLLKPHSAVRNGAFFDEKAFFLVKSLDGAFFIYIFVPFFQLRLKSQYQSNLNNLKIVETYALL